MLAQQTHRLSTKQNLHELGFAVASLLKEQGVPVDSNRLHSAVESLADIHDPEGQLLVLLQVLGIPDLPFVLSEPDAAYMPLLVHHRELGFGRVVQQVQAGLWTFQQEKERYSCRTSDLDFVAKIALTDEHIAQKNITFAQLLRQNLKEYKWVFVEAVLASLIINFLALAVSLYSMQVYDRVIPTSSKDTLIILSSGALLFIVCELGMKFARSAVMDKLVVGVDQGLSRKIFERLLRVRIDQMPNSVGSLVAQLRGYEQVRSFFTASSLFTIVDVPISLGFIVIIATIGSPWVALVPIVAAFIGILLGFNSRRKMDEIAKEGASASYLKTGILVETVEGMETIKAGSGNWKFLSRWLNVMDTTTKNDVKMRHVNDNLNYSVQMLQQISYIGIVIVGAFIVMNQQMTTGGLIACTILGGRILAPIMNLPNLLVQHSHSKAAQMNIERLFSLAQDNDNVSHPLSPSKIYGNYQCERLEFSYGDNDRLALQIPNLVINAGERVAILGSIGSGKSTLLKLLSGLYTPTQGSILVDGLDMNHISRESLNHQIGYLQQDHRLFQGTLRENLLIGMPTPNDDVLNKALHRTGLMRLVSGHSSGLDLPISEGGKGLSGGQKQLVAFTRLVLTQPSVWLMDEPTASMDNMQAQQCLKVVAEELKDPTKTLIVSTHKMELLALVNRVIIMANGQIVMDGPKQLVLDQLMKNEKEAAERQRLAQQQQAALQQRPQN